MLKGQNPGHCQTMQSPPHSEQMWVIAPLHASELVKLLYRCYNEDECKDMNDGRTFKNTVHFPSTFQYRMCFHMPCEV